MLDWFNQLRTAADPVNDLAGQQATVTGFVFRDERFAADQFMVTRYAVSCCVADASIVGLVVDWPEAKAVGAGSVGGGRRRLRARHVRWATLSAAGRRHSHRGASPKPAVSVPIGDHD